jgi:hypothetical protein
MPLNTGTTITSTAGCTTEAPPPEAVLTFIPDASEFISNVFTVYTDPLVLIALRLPPGAVLRVDMLYGCNDEVHGVYRICGCRPSLWDDNRVLPMGIPGRYRLRLSGTTHIERDDLLITYKNVPGLDWLKITSALQCCGGVP